MENERRDDAYQASIEELQHTNMEIEDYNHHRRQLQVKIENIEENSFRSKDDDFDVFDDRFPSPSITPEFEEFESPSAVWRIMEVFQFAVSVVDERLVQNYIEKVFLNIGQFYLKSNSATRYNLLRTLQKVSAFCAEYNSPVIFLKQFILSDILPIVFKAISNIDKNWDSKVCKEGYNTLKYLLREKFITIKDVEYSIRITCEELFANPYFPTIVHVCNFISRMSTIVSEELTEVLLLPQISDLCSNSSSKIREISVYSLIDLACNVNSLVTENIIIPLFIKLCQDDEWYVRKACAETLVTLSCLCLMESRRTVLCRAFIELLLDVNVDVSSVTFDQLGAFITTFAYPAITGLASNLDGDFILVYNQNSKFRLLLRRSIFQYYNPDPVSMYTFPTTHLNCVKSNLANETVDFTKYYGTCMQYENQPDLVKSCLQVTESRHVAIKCDSEKSDENSSDMLDRFNSFQFWRDPIPDFNDEDIKIDQQEIKDKRKIQCAVNCDSICNVNDEKIENRQEVKDNSLQVNRDSISDINDKNIKIYRQEVKDKRFLKKRLGAFRESMRSFPPIEVEDPEHFRGLSDLKRMLRVRHRPQPDCSPRHPDSDESNFDTENFKKCRSNCDSSEQLLDKPSSPGKPEKKLPSSIEKIADKDRDDGKYFINLSFTHKGMIVDEYEIIPDEYEIIPTKSTKTISIPLKHNIVPQPLMDAFVSVSEIVPVQSRLNHAYSFPAVLLTIGASNWPSVKDVYCEMSVDSEEKLRQIVANNIHEVAQIIGSDLATRDLMSLYHSLIKDTEIVRIAAVSHLSCFVKLLTLYSRYLFLSHLKEYITFDWNWRFRSQLSEQLTEMLDFFTPEDCSNYIAPVAFSLLMDKISAVRLQALNLITNLIRVMSSDVSLLRDILAELVEFAHSPKWTKRQSFAFLCSYLIKSSAIPEDMFARDVLPHLFDLTSDSIPNVRIALARTLSCDIISRSYFNDSNSPYYDILVEVLSTLCQDNDSDVRYFATLSTYVLFTYHDKSID